MRQKVFHSGITRDFAVLSVVLLLVGAGLIEMGVVIEPIFIGKGGWFGLAGAVVLASDLVLLYHLTGCFLIVTPEDITYQDRWSRVTIPWHEASDFHEPPEGQRLFRTAHLLNDRLRISISSLSFAKFDTILSVIRVARRSKYFQEDLYQIG